jgi:hypothetical protein
MADSEDFGSLIAVRYELVHSSDCKLAHRFTVDEIVKISPPVIGICGGRYTDPTKLIFVIVKCCNRIYIL